MTTPQTPIRLGDLLKDRGYIEDKHIRFALQVQKVTKEKLGSVLTRVGLVSEYDMVTTVAQQLELEYMDLSRIEPDYQILRRFNRNLCLNLRIFPLRVEGDEVVTATCEMPGQQLEQAVQRASSMRPRFVLAQESQIVSSIYNFFFFLENPVESLLAKEIDILAKDASMTVSPNNFINYMLLLAVKRRTSDIHIRPMEQGISIAYRIDGVLSNEVFLPPQLSRVITALKLMSGMDISEQRKPQDGRWTANILEKRYDIRSSSLVTPFGENIVMRLLPQERASFSLAALGFLEDDLAKIHKTFEEPFGIILLTGPTGSGKSTTLVAGLITLDLLGKNVLTIENPIEYVVPLARQTEVNQAAGYDFSNAMRFFMRHDPDVILIGEMRDEQTAFTALTAATTGHLVLSTLHSNTALGAIPRLRTLNMDNLTMAESLVCVVSQRLVRTICPYCKVSYTPSDEEKQYLGVEVETLHKGERCPSCNYTGYQGRTLVYEVLVFDRDLREMLERGTSIADIGQTAAEKGFRSMFDVGVIKTLKGQTTVEEMYRVLGRTRY